MQVYVSNITPFLKGDIWKQFIDRLDMERQEKVMRTRNEKDQVRILAAGLLLQYAVEQELGRKIPGTSLCIRQKEGGIHRFILICHIPGKWWRVRLER